jgi:hypothetical protein
MKKKIIFELKVLISNIDYLINYKFLIETIIDNCKHIKLDNELCHINKDLWKKNISPHLFRPFLKEFLNKYKSKYDFYIFTTLDRETAICLIEIIEEYTKVSFKKPIFTREDLLVDSTDKYQKEILFFSPLSDYIIIDKDEYWSKETKVITPKLYNYIFIPIIDSSILLLIRTLDLKVNTYLLPMLYTKNYDEFFSNYHLFTAQLFKSVKYDNEEFIKDDFFNKLSFNK